MTFGFCIGALIFPGSNMTKILVVSLSFAICCLILLPKVSAAAFVTLQRVVTHKLSELEKISHARSFFENRV